MKAIIAIFLILGLSQDTTTPLSETSVLELPTAMLKVTVFQNPLLNWLREESVSPWTKQNGYSTKFSTEDWLSEEEHGVFSLLSKVLSLNYAQKVSVLVAMPPGKLSQVPSLQSVSQP